MARLSCDSGETNEEEMSQAESLLPASDTGVVGLVAVVEGAAKGPGVPSSNQTSLNQGNRKEGNGPRVMKPKGQESRRIILDDSADTDIVEQERGSGATSASTSTANQATETHHPSLPRTVSKVHNVRSKEKHPPPDNKTAARHLRYIQYYGYRNFEEVPVDYWEPRRNDETKAAHNARRQRECKVMEEFIKRLEASKKNNKVQGTPVEAEQEQDAEKSIIDSQEGEIEALLHSMAELKERNKKLEILVEQETQARLALERRLQNQTEARSEPEAGKESNSELAVLKDQLVASEVEKEELQLQNDKLKAEHGKVMTHLLNLGEAMKSLKKEVETLQKENKELKIASTSGSQATSLDALKSIMEELLEQKLSEKLGLMTTQQGCPRRHPAPSEDSNQQLTPAVEKDGFILPKRRRRQRKGMLDGRAIRHPVLRKDTVPVPPPRQQQLRGYNNVPVDGNMPRTKTGNRGKAKNFKNLRVNIGRRPALGDSAPPTADSIGTASSLVPFGRTPDHETADLPTADSVKDKDNRQWTTVVKKGRERDKRAIMGPPVSQANAQKNTGSTTKVLILPSEGKRVQETLRDKKILPRHIGVTNVVEFTSGAMLATVQKEKKDMMLQKITEAGLTVKNQTTKEQYEWRIHRIPAEYPAEEVSEDIRTATGYKPSEVVIVPYKAEKNKGLAVAIVKGTRELFESIRDRRTLQIEYGLRLRVDTEPQLMRCKMCQLLGHTQNHCSGIPPQILQMQKEQGGCMDCHAYNYGIKKAGLPQNRSRPTNHQPMDQVCPTKKSLRRKYINATRRVDGTENNKEDAVTVPDEQDHG